MCVWVCLPPWYVCGVCSPPRSGPPAALPLGCLGPPSLWVVWAPPFCCLCSLPVVWAARGHPPCLGPVFLSLFLFVLLSFSLFSFFSSVFFFLFLFLFFPRTPLRRTAQHFALFPSPATIVFLSTLSFLSSRGILVFEAPPHPSGPATINSPTLQGSFFFLLGWPGPRKEHKKETLFVLSRVSFLFLSPCFDCPVFFFCLDVVFCPVCHFFLSRFLFFFRLLFLSRMHLFILSRRPFAYFVQFRFLFFSIFLFSAVDP